MFTSSAFLFYHYRQRNYHEGVLIYNLGYI